jgi:Uma2 family endonuclease
MSAITQPRRPASAPSGDCYPLYRMSIEQYEKLVDSGLFTRRDKFELINGLLVCKMTQNDPHSTSDTLTRDALMRVVPPGWHVRSDNPVRLPPRSKPEPDQSVARGTARDYASRSPGAADVGLVVQVAVSSLARDRKRSKRFAINNVPVYWIVDVVGRQVEVYTSPTAIGYNASQIYKPGDMVPVVLDGVVVGKIAVDDILP